MKDAFTNFYNALKPLYPETDVCGVSLGANLLQVKEDMKCGHDKVPDNVTLHPTVLPAKAYLAWSGNIAMLKWNH